MNLILQLAPGHTVTLQPYTLSDVAVGTPVSPSSVVGSLYTFNLSGLAAGDYNMRLLGNWQINGQAFPCRKTASAIYIADYWWQINAAIAVEPVIAIPTVPGTCIVRFRVYENDGQTPLVGATVRAKLGKNVAVDTTLLSNVARAGTTSSLGVCDLTLIQGSSIIKGSKYYEIEVVDPKDPDACELVASYRGIVPNQNFTYAEDLLTS